MSLSIIVITVQNQQSLTDIYGVEAYRNLAREVSVSICAAVGREPLESGQLPGSFLLVYPGMKSEAAKALAWHVHRRVPRELGHEGLLMPVEVGVVVETHDGSDRTIERLGTTRASAAVAA